MGTGRRGRRGAEPLVWLCHLSPWTGWGYDTQQEPTGRRMVLRMEAVHSLRCVSLNLSRLGMLLCSMTAGRVRTRGHHTLGGPAGPALEVFLVLSSPVLSLPESSASPASAPQFRLILECLP